MPTKSPKSVVEQTTWLIEKVDDVIWKVSNRRWSDWNELLLFTTGMEADGRVIAKKRGIFSENGTLVTEILRVPPEFSFGNWEGSHRKSRVPQVFFSKNGRLAIESLGVPRGFLQLMELGVGLEFQCPLCQQRVGPNFLTTAQGRQSYVERKVGRD
jgi:hypothetical protein